jgi:hypothetical protein
VNKRAQPTSQSVGKDNLAKKTLSNKRKKSASKSKDRKDRPKSKKGSRPRSRKNVYLNGKQSQKALGETRQQNTDRSIKLESKPLINIKTQAQQKEQEVDPYQNAYK